MKIKQFEKTRYLVFCLLILTLVIIILIKLIPNKELFTDNNNSNDYPKNNENKYDVNSIDAYLIINLDKEKKRYASVINNLVDTGVKEDKIHRIDAVYERWNGHLGCGKSHLKALEYAINKKYKTVAILEDDFNFIEDKKRVNDSIDSFLSNFKEWDFIDLYYSHVTELKKTNIKGIDKNNGTTGAVGYIVKNNFYNKLLQNRQEAVEKMQEYTNNHLIKCKDQNNCKRIQEQSGIAIDQYHNKLQKNNLWYSFVPKLGKLMDTPSTIMRESFNNTNYDIYCFWTGDNEMSENRQKALQSIIDTSDVNVILITPKNLDKYIIEPLHPGYKYLSEVHKSDYLRAYFMHYHGGGYSDIKHNNFSWIPYFEKLYNNPDKWAIGYKEIPGGACASNKETIKNYDKIFGNCMYIFKKNTPITTQRMNKLHNILDKKLELLKEIPSSFPRDQTNAKIPDTDKISKYPIAWAEIGGCILADILYKYRKNLLLDMPTINTSNYL